MRCRTWLLVTALAAPAAAQTQFIARTPAAVAATTLMHGIAADLDGDGGLDVCGAAGIYWLGPRIVLLRNEGSETFADVSAVSLPGTVTAAVPGYGNLRLDLSAGYVFFEGIVFANSGVHTYSLAVPPQPALVGLLYVQALAEQARLPAHFTAQFAVTMQ